ncbi:MAG: hypothetical protein IKZ47_00290 [Clostridia bacterium]|nr:hypothetical protein [Clostridia bacterium]
MKKAIAAVLLALLPIALCGCSGYRETDNEYIISAIAFKNSGGGFLAYAEVLDIGSDSDSTENKIFKARGDTPYKAVNALIYMLPKNAVFDHCAVAITENNIYGEDLKSVFDYLFDAKNLNLGIYMYNTAGVDDIFSCKAQELSVGYDIMAIQTNIEKTTGIPFKNKYYEVLSRIEASDGFCLPLLSAEDKRPVISGQTVYAHMLPALTLSEDEAVLFNLLFSGSSGGEISVSDKRCRLNGVTSRISLQGGGVAFDIVCNYRYGEEEELSLLLKRETALALKKIINANALCALGINTDKEVKYAGVRVNGN